MNTTVHAELVDELGLLNAQIAGLTARAEEIKEFLKGSMFKQIDGQLFRSTVVVQDFKVLDIESAENLLLSEGIEVPFKEVHRTCVRITGRT